MNSVERVKSICKNRKIPISKLEKDLGFSNGYIGQLRKGVFPDDRLGKIADYLGVTVDYLVNGEETDNKTLNEKDERDIKQAIEDFKNRLSTAGRSPIRNGLHCLRSPKLTHASTSFCSCSSAVADRLRLWPRKVRTYSR